MIPGLNPEMGNSKYKSDSDLFCTSRMGESEWGSLLLSDRIIRSVMFNPGANGLVDQSFHTSSEAPPEAP